MNNIVKQVLSKPCEMCGTVFNKPRGCSLSQWENDRKFCSKKCAQQHTAQQMKARWAAMSDEDRRALSVKLSESTKAQMSNPEARLNLSRKLSERLRNEGYKARFVMTPDIRAKISATQKGKKQAWLDDTERKEKAYKKVADASKNRFRELGQEAHELFRPDVRQRAILNSVEEGKTNPRRGRFETNCHADEWHLRDPQGREYHFRNLSHFIRNHHHLFSAQQLVIVKPTGRTKVEACLASLSPRKKFPTTCSQGWTWVLTPHEADPRLMSANCPPKEGTTP